MKESYDFELKINLTMCVQNFVFLPSLKPLWTKKALSPKKVFLLKHYLKFSQADSTEKTSPLVQTGNSEDLHICI